MKKIVLFSLMMTCLSLGLVAQNANNDLYFIPKKKTEKKVDTGGVPAKVVVETEKKTPTTVYASPGSTVVVKDAKGNVRDVDEYNRRYTSRDNTFSMENDTLYIEEKPYGERGEWVNGFEGSQSDYEYAMRIVRFRNPRYAIPVSSPLYWEVVYALPSWEWNVYDDGLYAYAFPTYSNSLWWDWRFSWGWSWRSPWYYSSWYSPGFWYGSYWGGWHHHHHWHYSHWHHHHHHHPHYGWAGVGGYWGNKHGWNGSSAHRPGIHAGRYENNYRTGYGATSSSASSAGRRVSTTGNRNSRDNYVNATRQSNTRNGNTVRGTSGRVVTPKEGSSASSVRPQRSAVRTRTGEAVNNRETTTNRTGNNVYTRPVQGRSSSYNRQSSTRSTVNNTSSGSSYRRSGASQRNGYSSGSSARNSGSSRSSFGSSRSSSSSSRGSYSSGGSGGSRSSYSSGGSRSSGGGGGGSVSSGSGGGGGSRGGGGGRR